MTLRRNVSKIISGTRSPNCYHVLTNVSDRQLNGKLEFGR